MNVILMGARPGAIIHFGAWPQTAEGAESAPIAWRVLQKTGNELLLISEHILDCRRYHCAFVDTSWRDCDLRAWLNKAFYEAAFTPAERARISTTCCTDNGAGSPDTEDKVFLFSIAEMRELTKTLAKDTFDTKRRAVGTEYAKAKKADGCRLFVYHGKVGDGYIAAEGAQHGVSWWWLRNQPSSPARAAFVGLYGSLRGYARVKRNGYGVRPVINLKLD